jgi:signal peptidase I
MDYYIRMPSGWRSITAVVIIGAGAILVGLSLLLGPPSFDVVAGTGMDPTLTEGSSVTARQVGPGQTGRGNMVVFEPDVWSAPELVAGLRKPVLVRRVVGLGGDTVACCDATGRLMVNGKPINEDYLPLVDRNPAKARTVFYAKVPAGHVFVVGDHRGESVDSRDGLGVSGEGAIPESHVLGVVVALNGEPPDQTSAFTAAGLPGGVFDDSTERYVIKVMVSGGIGMVVVGVFWFSYLQRRT